MRTKLISLAVMAVIITIFTIYWSGRTNEVDRYIDSAIAEHHIPGMAMIVLKDGEIIKSSTYGLADLELRVPVSLNSVFLTGSTGKAFTAAIIMKLVEQNKLQLDDRLSDFFTHAPKKWQGITVRQLLNHTSGITNYDKYLDSQRDYTDKALVRLAMAHPLDFEPGSKWSYSNTGYMLLGVIVKKITGKFYGDVLQELIFEPLGMRTAGVTDLVKIIPNRVSGYEYADGSYRRMVYVPPNLARTADGTLYMDVLDFSKWAEALFTGKVVNNTSLIQVITPTTLSDGRVFPYGFAWFIDDINGHKMIHHGGEFMGFSSYVSHYPEDKLTIVIVTNRAYIADDIGDMSHHIAGLYQPELMPKNPIRHKKDLE